MSPGRVARRVSVSAGGGENGSVPWCDDCARWYSPNTLNEDGSCPKCGVLVDEPPPEGEDPGPPKAPWHFWVMVGAAVVYLGWRFVQGIGWLIT